MSMSPARWIWATIASLVLAGCASGLSTAEPAAPAEGAATLLVVNARVEEVEIYIVRGAMLTRIGRVRSTDRATLALPPDVVESGSVRLGVSPQSYGDPMVSREIIVGPGDVVEWTIEQNLPLSQLRVRRRSGT